MSSPRGFAFVTVTLLACATCMSAPLWAQNPAVANNHFCPVGIVKSKERSLRKKVGGAKAGRVIGIALGLGRTAHVTLD